MFFVNGGIVGPALFLVCLEVLIIFFILDQKYHLPLMLFLVIWMCALFAINLQFPEWITPYPDLESQRWDFLFSSLIVSTICAAILTMYKRSYEEEKQKLRDALVAAQSSEKTKSTFLANMSHEIRTPLTGILGLTELLQTEVSPEDKKLFLETMHKSGVHLLNVINEILDYSKIESGKLEKKQETFSLQNHFEIFLESFSHSQYAKGKNLRIRKSFENCNLVIQTDKQKLEQIYSNLISNSLKFTEQGEVHISLKMETGSDSKIKLISFVEDTGVGISQKDLEQIFKAFYQIENSFSRKYAGTGLGLHITQRLVDFLGGTLHIESELGKGTKIQFEIPLEPLETNTIPETETSQKQANATSSSQDEILFQDLKILIAEDNPVNQLFLKKLFSKWKMEIDIANDGNEAFEKTKLKKYDVILMDLQMPKLDGYTSAKLILENNKEEVIPIVAISANTEDDDKILALETGMSYYLTKPVDVKNLITVLNLVKKSKQKT